MDKRIIPFVMGLLLADFALAISPPRMRPSPYFGNLLGMKYTCVEDLGPHHYEGGLFDENNALIYTAAAGYIDMGHLREAADRARYLFKVCHAHIQAGHTEFTFQVIEPAEYHVILGYPENWNSLSEAEKQQISREIAINLGQHFAQTSNIWHEIVTWYGYASTGLLSEKASSFSWEDTYSDLLGSKLAAMVLRNNAKDYDKAMAQVIARELKTLDPQSPDTAKQATALIQGKWYSGRYPFLSMKKRNFDVGWDDGTITPFRVPGICSQAEEILCTAGRLESLDQYGFTMRLQLTPRESEKRHILSIIDATGRKNTIEPDKHFLPIIQHIRNEAIKESGPLVDQPVL